MVAYGSFGDIMNQRVKSKTTKPRKTKKRKVKKSSKKFSFKAWFQKLKKQLKKRFTLGSKTKLVSRLIYRSVYWCTVVGIWSFVIFACILLYYAAFLPQTSEWTIPKRPPNIQVLSIEGHIIGNRGDTGGEAIALAEMPPHLVEAVLAIEDRRFYYHPGIDPIGLFRALVRNVAAQSFVEGGSTITQQLAKNLFLKPERTIERKMQELVLSFWLEFRLTKNEILELYLNRVYLGEGAFGVDAAARQYFGKSARNINLVESAMLAGLLKAPSRFSPINRPELTDERTRVVLNVMHTADYISEEELAIALNSPISVSNRFKTRSYNYAADWIMEQLPGVVGSIEEDIIVESTIDVDLQLAAEKAIRTVISRESEKSRVSQGAIVTINTTGAVRVIIGGASYQESQYNRAIYAKRQPGSAFKPFVYLAAFERGLTPDSVRDDRKVTIAGWTPSNYTNEYLGKVSLNYAFAHSLNTVAARIANEIGFKRVAEIAQRLGITSKLVVAPSLALGTSEVNPLELTAAYVPFSNGGIKIDPYVIKRIRTASGKVLYEHKGSRLGRVVNEKYIGMMNAMMRQVIVSGTGKNAVLENWQTGGKTGTTQNFRDAWFVGYTAELITGVWLGNDDGKSTKKVTGGSLPAEIWQMYMSEAHQGLKIAALPGNWRSRPANTKTGGTSAGPRESLIGNFFKSLFGG